MPDPQVDPLWDAAPDLGATQMPKRPDYRRLRRDFPPGGETTREQGYGAPADTFPPAEQSCEEYAETPWAAPGGEAAPDEPDFPPPEGLPADHDRAAVTLADAARDLARGEFTLPAPAGRIPPVFVPPHQRPNVPQEAIDVMTEERSDTRDPSEELERKEEEAGKPIVSGQCGSSEDQGSGVPKDDTPRPVAEDDDEADLDEALIESFPASDPIAPPRKRPGS